MSKNIKFDTYLIAEFLQEPQQAEAYLKEAIEARDLELLRKAIENLMRAGYVSFTITPKELIEQTDIQLEQQTKTAKIAR